MRTAPAWRPDEARDGRGWPRRELRAVRMRLSVLDDAAFCLARAGILTANQAKTAHKKIARTCEAEFKRVLRTAREKKAPRAVVPANRAHKAYKPITG